MLSVTRANFTPDNGSVIYADLAVLVQTCTQGPSFCLHSARSHATLAGQDFSCWGACALCWQIFILGRVSANASQQQRAPSVHITQPAATWGFPRRALCLLQRGVRMSWTQLMSCFCWEGFMASRHALCRQHRKPNLVPPLIRLRVVFHTTVPPPGAVASTLLACCGAGPGSQPLLVNTDNRERSGAATTASPAPETSELPLGLLVAA